MGILNKYKSKRKSIFYFWLASYITILLIPIVINIVAYYETGAVIENEINRANNAILKQVVQMVDSRLEDVERLGNELMLNEKVKALMYVKKPLTDTERYIIGDLVKKDMILSGSVNSFVNSFYIYFKNGDFVLLPGAYYEPEVAYQDFHQNSDLSYQQWYDMMHGKYYKEFITISSQMDEPDNGNTITYIQSLPFVGMNSDANLVVLLNENQIRQTVKNIEWIQNGNFLIIDKKDNVLFSNSKGGLEDTFSYKSLDKGSGILHEKINGEEVVVSYYTSDVMEWKYISVIPVSVFMQKAAYVRKIIVYSVLVCILVGAFSAFFFARRNYSPLNELVMLLGRKNEPTSGKVTNEYQFIRETVQNVLAKKDEFGKQLELQNKEMLQGFLTRLLRGKVSSTYINEQLASYQLDFSSGSFAVMLFRIEDFTQFFNYENHEYSEEDINLVEFSVINVVEELTGQNHRGYLTEVNGMIACIVNLRDIEMEKGKEELFRIAEEAKKFINGSLYISLTIAISNIHEKVTDIPQVYQEALEALEYKMLVGSGEIIAFDETRSSGDRYHYTMEMEQQLINNIKTANYKKSKEILDEIYITNFQKGTLSVDMSKCLMFDLVSTVIKTLNDFSESFGKGLWEKTDPMGTLLKCETAQEMKRCMEDILKKVCEEVENQKESHNTGLKEEIIQYIMKEYTNMDLGNASIADKFNLNTAYLSRFFKEQTGEGLLDFISKVRLEKAKHLLKTQKFSIGEVATKVGYYNNIALIRAFKKYEGITPGKFKEL